MDDVTDAQPTDRRVFLHYTQAELDRNFDQRTWAANASEVIERYVARSAATRARRRHHTALPYGPSADEVLDIFPAERTKAPIQIFVHGGAWTRHDKDDFSFVAETFVPAGFHTVVLNFTNLPAVRLPEMVAQVRRGVAWVWRNADSFGGDPDRIELSAHSSGAHLSVITLVTDWAEHGVPANVVKRASFLSGLYDLEPVMLSARRSYVHLSPDEVAALNPMRHAGAVPCPLTLAYAENDTDEFRRQTRTFADRLEASGRSVRLLDMPGLNHFEILEQLGSPDTPLSRAIVTAPASGP